MGSSPATSAQERPLAIEARGLVKRFDGFTAVDGVDLSVPEGAIYGILGPNGAGKTTTLRMLLGIIDPDEGLRRILGHDRPHEVAHTIGYLPEERGLYPSMKAYEAIAFMGALRGLPLKEGRRKGKELLEAHGLGYAIDRQDYESVRTDQARTVASQVAQTLTLRLLDTFNTGLQMRQCSPANASTPTARTARPCRGAKPAPKPWLSFPSRSRTTRLRPAASTAGIRSTRTRSTMGA